ncbi:MAG: recombinase family protein [Pseudomonadota bacterium]
MDNPDQTNRPKAVIYCRSASMNQTCGAPPNAEQEACCRTHAEAQGLIVDRVFVDEGVSGNALDRPSVKALFAHLDAHPADRFVVLVEDIARIGRSDSTVAVFSAALRERGAELQCVSGHPETGQERSLMDALLSTRHWLMARRLTSREDA